MSTAGARRNARGFALITTLLMVLVLAGLAMAAMNSSILQERMAGNSRDQNIALQSAEAGLRDGEADVLANLDASAAFSAACTNGLCVAPSLAQGGSSVPIWQSITWDSAHTRLYGQYTGATALPDVAAQPRYIVESLPGLPPAVGNSVALGGTPGLQPQVFRITAQGFGLRSTTAVTLQSIYVKQ